MLRKTTLLIAAVCLSLGTSALAAPKKKKGSKKKKADAESGETDFGPGDIEAVSTTEADTSGTIHGAQEGVDRPYLFEVGGNMLLSFLTKTAGEGDPVATNQTGLGGQVLFLLGKFAVGPALSYNNYSTETTTTTTNPVTNVSETTTSKYTSTSLEFGATAKMNFGDLDKSDLVPFAYATILLTQGESKSGDADASKTSGNKIALGGGVNFFLDSNVSFQPQGQYVMESEKADAEGAEEVKTSGFEILLGLATFL